MSDLSALSESSLDAAYAACWDARDYAAANFYQAEIIRRMTTVGGYVAGMFSGILGMPVFPEYEKRVSASGGYTFGEAALSSVPVGASVAFDSAGSLLSGAVSGVAGAVGSITAPLILLAGLALVILIKVKK